MAARVIGSGWIPGRIGGRAGSGARASASGRSDDPRAAGVGGDRRSSRATRRGGRADDCRCRLGIGPRLTTGARLAPALRAAGRPYANAGARDDDDGGARKRRGDRHVANVAGNDRARVASSPPARPARGEPTGRAGGDDKISGTPRGSGGTPAAGPTTATELRREASAILRALSAARAAPGGLRASLGDEPALISRLLDALCAAGMLYQANALFREALDANVVASPIAVESLVRHGVRAGRAAEVALAFDAYVRAGGEPTLRTFTDLITALSKRELTRRSRGAGDDDAPTETKTKTKTKTKTAGDGPDGNRTPDAVDLWQTLLASDRLTPDAQAYTAAVGAYMAHGSPDRADALVREMNRRGIAAQAGARLYNVLIAAAGRRGDVGGIRTAERAMRDASVRPNAATHGARVAAYARCGDLTAAERALRSGMGDRASARPTVHAYTALVQGLARVGRVDDALDWIRRMSDEGGVSPNAHTYSTIVDGLVRVGDVARAEALVEEMRANGVQPTAVTYNTLLKSCVFGDSQSRKDGGKTDGARGADSFSSSAGVQSSSVGVLDGDADAVAKPPDGNADRANLERARRVLESMRAAGIETTVVTYNTLIDACVKNGEPTEAAMGVLSALVAAGHRPDVVTYTTLLKHFGKEGDVAAARWLMGEMRSDAGTQPDATAINCLVDALCRRGLFAEAHREVAAMVADGLAPDLNTYGAFMDGFARLGDVHGARALYDAMTGRSSNVWIVDDAAGKFTKSSKSSKSSGSSGSSASSKVAGAGAGVEVKTPPDARVRLALVTACARAGLAKADALEVLAAVEADVERSNASQAEVDELQARFRREREAGRGARVRGGRVKDGDGGGARTKAADPRAGCPIPSSWGPQPRSSPSTPSATSSATSSSSSPSTATPYRRVDAAADDTDDWSRGLEMWKHWLGLPSRYYDGRRPDAVVGVGGASDATATPDGAVRNDSPQPLSEKQRYTKAEIAEAVRVLRAAAAKRYPNDPDRALEAALEAANDGDALSRVLRDDDFAAGDVDSA